MKTSCLCLVLLVSACCQGKDDGQGRITTTESQAANLPAVEVELPPAPSFDKPVTPEKHADGSFSVHGLRKNLATLLNQDVQVKGVIVSVYTCACPKKDKSCRCQKPHFFLADKPDVPADKALLVTDYPAKGAAAKRFQVGAELTLTGSFGKASASGFSASDGLLIYKE